MKTSRLIELLPDDNSHAILQFEGGNRYNVGTVTYITGKDPTDAVIEAGELGVVSAHALRQSLGEQEPDGDVQLFVTDGDGYAYYDVKSVNANKIGMYVIITAGAFRTGGGY
jgi:hypothetical protein